MSNGENLLSLQEVDIELSQLKDKLAQLPELKDLAKKRRALAAAKEELLKVVALRKDAETDLADLADEEAEYRRRVDEAQKSVDSSDYHRVQNLEIELSNLTKWLDKVAFDQRSCTARLEETSAREQKGREFIEKLEAAIIRSGQAARVAATDLQNDITELERRREKLTRQLPDSLHEAYTVASKQFRGLGVEKLEGSTPSLCRMALTEASLNEVKRTKGVTTCPYCHRILIVDEGDRK